MKWIRRILIGLGVLVGVLVVLLIGLYVYVEATWNRPNTRAVAQMTAPKDAQTVARGEYLYNATLLCWGCHGTQGSHSPAEPQAGGKEWDLSTTGPGFGFLYSPNLTPDQETGIGSWSDGELVRAIREGLDREGHLIFPMLPYEWTNGLSDADALAMVAYLRSIPPVRNPVPANKPSFFAKAMPALGIMQPKPAIASVQTAPPRGPTAEYGKYLASNASGCAECHTPRDFSTGAYDFTRPLAGGLAPFPDEPFDTIPSNLTPDAATGIGNWTEAQFFTAMRTGTRPNGTVVLPFMPWPYYARWTDDDLRAVWLYLRTLKPVEHAVPGSKLTGKGATGTGAARGEGIFEAYCLVCHGEKGAGAPPTKAVLKDVAKSMDDATVTKFINEGISGTSMPGFGKTLSKEQIADVIAYVRTLAK